MQLRGCGTALVTPFSQDGAVDESGFAEGAVRAAEWLAGKRGFFEFREICREL